MNATTLTLLLFAAGLFGYFAVRSYRRVSRDVDHFIEVQLPRYRVWRLRREWHESENN